MFKVGDRVIAIAEVDGDNLIGRKGTIKVIIFSRCPLGIEFDESFDSGHTLDGKGKHFHCRWGEETSFKKIDRKYNLFGEEI